ncbi:MAG TPA: hypothetical protein VKH41_01455 [Myxococcota bacterium]|nr:hypothetical protein [Myxococcota bacterium]
MERRSARIRRARGRHWSCWAVALALLGAVTGVAGRADEVSKQQMHSLDEQVQDIKSDVLGIASELNRLEERLLYPSDTQLALFVSMKEGETFRLDSVSVQIDGQPVARHIYSFKELEALQKGGVQRIYTGNVATGDHRLDVAMAGKLPSGADFQRNQSFSFSKKVEPKLVGITLADSGDASIQLGAW